MNPAIGFLGAFKNPRSGFPGIASPPPAPLRFEFGFALAASSRHSFHHPA